MRERLGRYIKNANPNKLPNYKMTCKFWEKVILGMENMGDLKMSTSLNDTGDILVRLKPTREYLKKLEQQKETMKYFATEEYEGEEEMEDGQEKDSIFNCSFFFYVPGEKNKTNGDFLYFDSPTDEINNLRGVSMNERFIFMWNEGHAWKIDLVDK